MRPPLTRWITSTAPSRRPITSAASTPASFFADAVHAFGDIGGSGELVDLQWIPIDDAAVMDNCPSPTRGALAVAKRLVLDQAPLPQAAEAPVPALITRYGVEAEEFD